jgi:hypothetical protein
MTKLTFTTDEDHVHTFEGEVMIDGKLEGFSIQFTKEFPTGKDIGHMLYAAANLASSNHYVNQYNSIVDLLEQLEKDLEALSGDSNG